jgi:hypothetical protein
MDSRIMLGAIGIAAAAAITAGGVAMANAGDGNPPVGGTVVEKDDVGDDNSEADDHEGPGAYDDDSDVGDNDSDSDN